MSDSYILFNQSTLRDFLRDHQGSLIRLIDGYPDDYILKLNIDEVCNQLDREYRLQPPVLKTDETYTKGHGERDGRISVKLAVPFDGNPQLFDFQPSTFNYNPPRGIVEGQEVCLTYSRSDYDHAAIKRELDNDIGGIKQFLGWVAADVAPFNAGIKGLARQRIEFRRDKLLKEKEMIEKLGFPTKKPDKK